MWHITVLLALMTTNLISPGVLAQTKTPPQQLRVKVERSADGWRITNLNFGYAWQECRAEIGTSSVAIKALPPDLQPVTLKRSEFMPALTPDADSEKIWISCKVGRTTFIATADAK